MIFLFILNIIVNHVLSQKKYILTSHQELLSECTIGSVGKNFKGISIEIFNKVSQKLSWSDSDWDFVCINETDYAARLNDTNLALAYLPHLMGSTQTYDDNMFYSRPLMNTGASLLVWQEDDRWMFIKIFTIEVGVLIIVTAIFIAFLHFIFEKKNYSFDMYLWNMFSALFFINQIRLYRISSRLTVLCFWLIALIVTASYTANLTSIRTIEADAKQISNINQISQKKIKANLEHMEKIYFYGADVYSSFDGGYSIGERISESMILNDFQRGDVYKMDGIVVDDSFASMMEQKYCHIYKVAPLFLPNAISLIFNKNQNQTLVNEINNAITSVTTSLNPIIIKNQYITKNFKKCKKVSNSNKIGISDMEGLWIILAIAMGISIFLFLCSKTDLYDKKLLPWLDNYQMIEISKEKDKLIGDDLLISNINEICDVLISKAEESVKNRLDIMEENIMKFYEEVFSKTNDHSNSNFEKEFNNGKNKND